MGIPLSELRRARIVSDLESRGTKPVRSLKDAVPRGAEIIEPMEASGRPRDIVYHDPRGLIDVLSQNLIWRLPERKKANF